MKPAAPSGTTSLVRVAAVALAVAVAFADSSIVVLALPEIFAEFSTTIEGVAWVITSYNVVVAVCALALILVVRRVPAHQILAAGALVFLAASIVCAVAGSLGVLVAARSVQGLGAALLLAGSLPVLLGLAGSTARGVTIWTAAGTIGAAVGPALGGALTQVFDWPAIFVVQAPIAGAALLATFGLHLHRAAEREPAAPLLPTAPANLCLALIFGALAGTLFLGVLLVINVFGYSPIEGAAIVSLIPAATILAGPLAVRLSLVHATAGGAVLLASGLVGLALLPSSDIGFAMASFALCGVGLGLCVPGLTNAVLGGGRDLARRGTLTVGARHLGLVVALAVVAPVLARDLTAAAEVAMLNATAVVIDGRIPATTKIPLALDIRDVLAKAEEGEIPDFTAVFEEHGSTTDPAVERVQADLVDAIQEAVTRGFRGAFVFCAALAMLAAAAAGILRRRLAP
ncbi:MAG: MFS transporter [Actinobacteria bacterium]|nr:MFS transporter [Actinomycetota bacterium]